MMIVCATLSIPDFFSRATSGKDSGDLLFHERPWSGAPCDQTMHATGAVDIRGLALLLHDALSRAGEAELVLGLRGTLHESGVLESSVAEEAHHGGLRGREAGGAGASLGWRAVRTGGVATDSVGRCSRRSRGRGGRVSGRVRRLSLFRRVVSVADVLDSVLLHSTLLPPLGLFLCGLLVRGAALPVEEVVAEKAASGVEGGWRDGGMVWVHVGRR